MSSDQPRVVVYPPDQQGGRRVRADGETLGRAFGPGDLLEFLRRAGLAYAVRRRVSGLAKMPLVQPPLEAVLPLALFTRLSCEQSQTPLRRDPGSSEERQDGAHPPGPR
ncbi:hypothetical protein ACIRP0_36805 [Streptomyces sp. NPDC101733]|uniref:hypothetical protein n=1 Tax=unclassified Streptomyces TaxID=2593676 RepID=UPI0037F5038D